MSGVVSPCEGSATAGLGYQQAECTHYDTQMRWSKHRRTKKCSAEEQTSSKRNKLAASAYKGPQIPSFSSLTCTETLSREWYKARYAVDCASEKEEQTRTRSTSTVGAGELGPWDDWTGSAKYVMCTIHRDAALATEQTRVGFASDVVSSGTCRREAGWLASTFSLENKTVLAHIALKNESNTNCAKLLMVT